MTKKPRILKKVEELSDQIAKFVAGDEDLEIEPENIDRASVSYWPDFRVQPRVESTGDQCRCFYGGEEIHCYKDETIIEDCSEKELKWPDKLLNGCIVRQYTEIFLKGEKKLEEAKKTHENIPENP